MSQSCSSFTVIDASRLHRRTWGSETVVYDDRTGDTHLLGANAAKVLGALLEGAATVRQISIDSGIEDADDIDEILQQLVQLKLCLRRQ